MRAGTFVALFLALLAAGCEPAAVQAGDTGGSGGAGGVGGTGGEGGAGGTGGTAGDGTPVCGDGVVQPGEECDDGNRQDLDNCTNDCKVATCGNGKVEKYTTFEYTKRQFFSRKFTSPFGVQAYLAIPGTGCKDGPSCELWNVPTAPEHGLCQALGFGVAFSVDWNGSEGASQATQLHINNWNCQAIDDCGPGINATNEVCFAAGCMLKVLDCRGEQCDDGAANNDHLPDACRTSCQGAHCGDGVVDTAEECDDGNGEDGDGCSSDCKRE